MLSMPVKNFMPSADGIMFWVFRFFKLLRIVYLGWKNMKKGVSQIEFLSWKKFMMVIDKR